MMGLAQKAVQPLRTENIFHREEGFWVFILHWSELAKPEAFFEPQPYEQDVAVGV